MKTTTACSSVGSTAIALIVQKERSKTLDYNTVSTNTNTLDGHALRQVEAFTRSCSISYKQGVTDADVEVQVGKAGATTLQAKNIWNSKQLSANTKVRTLNANVEVILSCGAEIRRTATTITKNV
ncbi:unnamed protein product [Schistosoma curassoni]|uniref:DUF6451 domain-containing protein n=1 Tax=Schistosoma curassoni TaxID=6186 RepID=A0A183KVH3_9TREM|nr:unnamed protein product [Schistosoma curassoni]